MVYEVIVRLVVSGILRVLKGGVEFVGRRISGFFVL